MGSNLSHGDGGQVHVGQSTMVTTLALTNCCMTYIWVANLRLQIADSPDF